MKTLSCACRNCGIAMQIEVEEQDLCSDEFLASMACCDRCYDARERIEKANRERYDKQIEKELSQPDKPSKRWNRQPYND